MDRLNIFTFKKCDHEQIRVDAREYRDRFYLDVRLWFKPDDSDYIPSKKGLTIGIEHVEDLREGLRLLAEWNTARVADTQANFDSNYHVVS